MGYRLDLSHDTCEKIHENESLRLPEEKKKVLKTKLEISSAYQTRCLSPADNTESSLKLSKSKIFKEQFSIGSMSTVKKSKQRTMTMMNGSGNGFGHGPGHAQIQREVSNKPPFFGNKSHSSLQHSKYSSKK